MGYIQLMKPPYYRKLNLFLPVCNEIQANSDFTPNWTWVLKYKSSYSWNDNDNDNNKSKETYQGSGIAGNIFIFNKRNISWNS